MSYFLRVGKKPKAEREHQERRGPVNTNCKQFAQETRSLSLIKNKSAKKKKRKRNVFMIFHIILKNILYTLLHVSYNKNILKPHIVKMEMFILNSRRCTILRLG